jgi:hypothetical protein
MLGVGTALVGDQRVFADPLIGSAGTGVTDPDCKIQGIDNLYVCGRSVFPCVAALPPTAAIMRVALQFAEHLVTIYRSQQTRTPRAVNRRAKIVPPQHGPLDSWIHHRLRTTGSNVEYPLGATQPCH